MTIVLKDPGNPVRLEPFSNIVNVGWGGQFILVIGAWNLSGSAQMQTGVVPIFLANPFVDIGEFEEGDTLSDKLGFHFGTGNQIGGGGIGFAVNFINISKIYATYIESYGPSSFPTVEMATQVVSAESDSATGGQLRSILYPASSYDDLDEYDPGLLFDASVPSSVAEALDLLTLAGGGSVVQEAGPTILSDGEESYQWVWDYANRGDPDDPTLPFFELT